MILISSGVFDQVLSGGVAGVLVRKRCLLVYELVDYPREEPHLPKNVRWAQATRDIVEDLFRHDPRRKETFLRFIDRGYYGVIIYHDSQWMNYGWMSMPDTCGPPHLPVSIQQRHACWLFYAHTLPRYRGCGLHKYSIQLRVAHALNTIGHVRIYTDTTAENTASRKGIVSMGFKPEGIIHTVELMIPRVKRWVWGSWDMKAEHPPLDGGKSD
jgi:RimJ/RimL family protein N-acetyltransferase